MVHKLTITEVARRLGIRTVRKSGKHRKLSHIRKTVNGPYGAYRRCRLLKRARRLPRKSLSCSLYYKQHWNRNHTLAKRPTAPRRKVLAQLARKYNAYARAWNRTHKHHKLRLLSKTGYRKIGGTRARKTKRRVGHKKYNKSLHPHKANGQFAKKRKSKKH